MTDLAPDPQLTSAPYEIYGALGSPYSQKMRAVLRYRRIPHVWIMGRRAHELSQQLKAPVIPVIRYPDGTLHNDSTPMIYELERRHPGRSIVPDDEADAFLAALIEDYADEWGTKAMFQYRWLRDRDQTQMSLWLALDSFPGMGRDVIESFAAGFRARQVGRMPIVGCLPENDPLIVATARAALAAIEDLAFTGMYLFGSRPSLAEFALFGQFSQLATDPTPQEMMRADFPFAYRWMAHLDDLSGHEGAWRRPDEPRPAAVQRFLELCGSVYLPFLVANAQAVQEGAREVRFTAQGHDYRQGPFKYQVKCLAELRRRYAALSAAAKTEVDTLLGPAGCLPYLT